MNMADLFQLVMTQRQVSFEAAQYHLRQRHRTLLSRLATIDAQRTLVAIEGGDRQSRQFATAQSRSVQQRQDRYPKMRAVSSTKINCRSPQRLHLHVTNPLR